MSTTRFKITVTTAKNSSRLHGTATEEAAADCISATQIYIILNRNASLCYHRLKRSADVQKRHVCGAVANDGEGFDCVKPLKC